MSNISGASRSRPMPGSYGSRPSPSLKRVPSVERRRTERPTEAFSAVLFSNSALSGSIPCTPGTHSLASLGLERLSLFLKQLVVTIPQDTQLQVHSHTIDRDAVTREPAPASMAAWMVGFVSFWTLAAWMWVVGTFGTKRNGAEPQFKVLEAPPKAPRDGVLRMHGLEAGLTQPLTLTRQGIPPWLVHAKITGAGVDEHGVVTPRGELRLFGLLGLSLGRFRRVLPMVNMEVEKLRQGQVIASDTKTQSALNTDAVVDTLARLTGQGTFTVVRQPDAPTLRYRLNAGDMTNFISDVHCDITPLTGEIAAKVKLNPDATLQLMGESPTANSVRLRGKQVGDQTLRVETKSNFSAPENASKWLHGHTVFVVDRSPSGDPMADVWEPLVSGSVDIKGTPQELRTTSDVRLEAGILPGVKGRPNLQSHTRWVPKGSTREWVFEHATMQGPAPEDLKELDLSLTWGDVKVKARSNAGCVHVDVRSTVVDVDNG